MDLEIIVQTMLYVFRDDEHNTKIENMSIFFQTTFRVLVSYLLFLNSIKKKKTALLPKFLKFFFSTGQMLCHIILHTLGKGQDLSCMMA